MKNNKKVLLIHTGGTFGMKSSKNSEENISTNNDYLYTLFSHVPELKKIANLELKILCNIDSSDINIEIWITISHTIIDNWHKFDGFVIIHGTDTMAYTATALSFFLSGLTKPIILTGSQRPLSELRSDARANIIDAVELATSDIPEVMVCFDNQVHRGSRVIKYSCEHMQAFKSHNIAPIGNFGVHFNLNKKNIHDKIPHHARHLPSLDSRINNNIISIDAVPSIILHNNIIDNLIATTEGIIIRAFGTGNLPTNNKTFLLLCEKALTNKIPVIMATQCRTGSVNLSSYQAGREYASLGVISALDMSFEALSIKLMIMLGRQIIWDERHEFFATPLAKECDNIYTNY